MSAAFAPVSSRDLGIAQAAGNINIFLNRKQMYEFCSIMFHKENRT